MRITQLLLQTRVAFGMLCVIAFVLYFSYYSTGIPQSDDYPMMIGFLDKWDTISGVGAKYQLLVEQFLEHRMLAMKLTALGMRAILGRIDMVTMCIVGIAVWLGTFYQIFRASRRVGMSVICFVPVVSALLNPGYTFDGLFWAATWMAFPWAIFLCAASFYFLIFHPNRQGFGVATLLALLALFSHGNGVCAFIVGGLVLVVQGRWKTLVLWALVAIGGTLLFFFNYQWASSSVTSPSENLFANGFYVLASLGAFVGSVLYFPEVNQDERALSATNVHAVVFGLGMCLVFLGYYCYLWREFSREKDKATADPAVCRFRLFCWSLGALAILTGAMMSVLRVKTEVILGFIGRYHFYSLLVVCTAYLILCSYARIAASRRFQLASYLAGMAIWLASYWVQTVDVADHVRRFQAGLYNSKTSGRWIIYGGVPYFEDGINRYANRHLWLAGSSNYRFPAVRLTPAFSHNKVVELSLSRCEVTVRDTEHTISIDASGEVFGIPNFGRNTDGAYMYLISGRTTFLYPLLQKRSGVRALMGSGRYFKEECSLALPKSWFPKGVYKLFLYVPGTSTLFHARRTVTIR